MKLIRITLHHAIAQLLFVKIENLLGWSHVVLACLLFLKKKLICRHTS